MALFGQRYPGMARRPSLALFILQVVFGLYLINSSKNFVKIPAALSGLNPWLLLISGALLILSGFMYLMARRY